MVKRKSSLRDAEDINMTSKINVKDKSVLEIKLNTDDDFEGNEFLKEPFKELNIFDLVKSDEVELINEAFGYYNKERNQLLDALYSGMSLEDKYGLVLRHKQKLRKINEGRYLFKMSANRHDLKIVPQILGKYLELIVYRTLIKCKLSVDYEKEFNVLGRCITPDFYLRDLNRLVEVKLTRNLTDFKNKRIYRMVDKDLLVVYISDVKNSCEDNKDAKDLNTGGKISIYNYIELLEEKYGVSLEEEYVMCENLDIALEINRRYSVGNICLLPESKVTSLIYKMDRELRELQAELDCIEAELKIKLNSSVSLSKFSNTVKGASLRINKLRDILSVFEGEGYVGVELETLLKDKLNVTNEGLKDYLDVKRMTLDTVLELESILKTIK